MAKSAGLSPLKLYLSAVESYEPRASADVLWRKSFYGVMGQSYALRLAFLVLEWGCPANVSLSMLLLRLKLKRQTIKFAGQTDETNHHEIWRHVRGGRVCF